MSRSHGGRVCSLGRAEWEKLYEKKGGQRSSSGKAFPLQQIRISLLKLDGIILRRTFPLAFIGRLHREEQVSGVQTPTRTTVAFVLIKVDADPTAPDRLTGRWIHPA